MDDKLNFIPFSSSSWDGQETPNHEALLCANCCLSILKTVLSQTIYDPTLLYDCLEAIEMCSTMFKTEAVEGDPNRELAKWSGIAEEVLHELKRWLRKVLQEKVPCYNVSVKHEELMVCLYQLFVVLIHHVLIVGGVNFSKMVKLRFARLYVWQFQKLPLNGSFYNSTNTASLLNHHQNML